MDLSVFPFHQMVSFLSFFCRSLLFRSILFFLVNYLLFLCICLLWPLGEYLVSVGGYIYLWDWRKSILMAKVKASSNCSEITSVTFSSNRKFIVTSGNKHLKFWTVGSFQRTRSSKVGSLAFHGKQTDNGFQKGNSFVSLVSINRVNSSGIDEQSDEFISIYALTEAGIRSTQLQLLI